MIAAVEKAMLARLAYAAERGAIPYRWPTLETYPEDWDQYFKNKGTLRTPAAWVVFGGFDKIEDSNDGPIATASFGLVVADTNLRDEEATRHGRTLANGATTEPGSYRLMLDSAGLLAGQDLGLDMSELSLVEVAQVRSASQDALRRTSLWALRFTTRFTVPFLEIDEDAADFTAFHANWDIRPFGNVDADPAKPGVQLPADATADATDHVRFP